MQKAVLYFLALLFLCLLTPNVQASHQMGADLSYRCVSGNTYEVTLRFYRDCSGILPSTEAFVRYSSLNCGQSERILRMPQTQVTEVSPLCPTSVANSTCNGGTLPGVMLYEYKALVTLPQNCTDWVLTWNGGGGVRNSMITNIANPTSVSMFIFAQLDNSTVSCNSSPIFNNLPITYLCPNQPFNYNHGAIDTDGDSLVYKITAPLDDSPTNPLTYIAPFSNTNPLSSSTGFTLNQQTGEVIFTPTSAEVTVMAVTVEEYRNGVFIGSTMRDMQVIVLPNATCTNTTPTYNVSNVSGGFLRNNTFETCPGATLSFDIVATDVDLDIISVGENISSALPGATVTTTNGSPASATVSWLVDPSFINRSFFLSFTDDACPISGTAIFTFGFSLPTVAFNATAGELCPNESTKQLTTIGATAGTYTWSSPATLNDPSSPNPIATIASTPATYNITYTSPEGCIATNSLTVERYDIVLNTNTASANYCNGDPAVNLSAQLLVGGVPFSTTTTEAYTETTNDVCITTDGGVHQVIFNAGVPASTSTVTFSFCVNGDYNSTFENIEVFDENGNNLGLFFNGTGITDCNTTCASLTVSAADWNTWNSDGQVIFNLDASSNVNMFTCSGQSCASGLSVSYDKLQDPPTPVNTSINYPIARSFSQHQSRNTDATIFANSPFTFSGTPTGNTTGGTLTVVANGNVNSPTEFWDIMDENNTLIGSIGATGVLCNPTSVTINLSQAQINSWAANGSIGFTAIDRNSNIASNLFCSADSLFLQLDYDYNETECSGTTISNPHTITFTNQTEIAKTDVTLEFCVTGDYDQAGVEQIELFGEDGLSLGVFDAATAGITYSDCDQTTPLCNTVTIPFASWNLWRADNIVTLSAVPNANVDLSCSGDFSCLASAQVNFISEGNALYTWSPSNGLNNPFAANVVAQPTLSGSSLTYTVQASDGVCTASATVTLNCLLLEEGTCKTVEVTRKQNGSNNITVALQAKHQIQRLELERSTNGFDFQKVATLETLENQDEYQMLDASSLSYEGYYYRLKAIAIDNTAKYICETIFSKGVQKEQQSITLFPNPTANQLNLQFYNKTVGQEGLRVTIIDVLGQVIYSQTKVIHNNQNRLVISTEDLPSGLYFIRIQHPTTGSSNTLEFTKL